MQTLWQINAEVRRHTGEMDMVAIGPQWADKAAAEKLLIAINDQIALGNEKHFRNPVLLCVRPGIEVNTATETPTRDDAIHGSGDQYFDFRQNNRLN